MPSFPTVCECRGLSGTNLEGEFNPSVLSNLTSLKTLILDNNTISGILHLGSIYNNFGHPNRTLQLVSIRNNNITNVTYNGTIASVASSITFKSSILSQILSICISI
ncbi:hypothetical protein M758_10G082900 [Ceratodon purpureus]|nr:hypothetical protein M758_10G082900 [Ceratodon purpureus]